MIDETTSLLELAAIVSTALEKAGIIASLSGGAAVSIYTSNQYLSEDLDFVTVAMIDELESALGPLGYERTGTPRLAVFEHPRTRWYLEFPPAPLSFGSLYVDPADCAVLDAGAGKLRIITPTHSVIDRLIAAAVWHEQQSLEQALLVARSQTGKIDWSAVDSWVIAEGIEGNRLIRAFYEKAGRPGPKPQ